MKRSAENFLIGTAVILIIIGFSAACVFLISHWPIYTLLGYGATVLVGILYDLQKRRRLARTLAGSAEIRDEVGGEFVGIYVPHWESGGIRIATGKTRLLFPLFESWDPSFLTEDEVPGCSSWPDEYLIRFRGTPSRRGHFGHMGGADRTVRITEILEIRLLKLNRQKQNKVVEPPATTHD